MENYKFLDDKGTFCMKQAENCSYLYFPVAGKQGQKSALTPNLGGDSKINQNQFILEPVSAENLHNNRASRNFWCHVKGLGSWSATGMSAEAVNEKFTNRQEKSEIEAGLMWQKARRESIKYQLQSEVTSFIPLEDDIEIMYVTICNIGKMQITFTPTAAVPIYGRSAANVRDHRHVTSLLHRIKTIESGIEVKPALSFDERGHQKNEVTYFVLGVTGKGEMPSDFYPIVEDYIGEGGNYERPMAIVQNLKGVPAGTSIEGMEAIGGLHFQEVTLKPAEIVQYTILIGATKKADTLCHIVSQYYNTFEKVEKSFEKMKTYWQKKVNIEYKTSDSDFDNFMQWVSFQPILRRIYGCSFLPHHDYGKGGRGWRDLWQDCLALLIMNPDGVREMLVSNFTGVRMDGSWCLALDDN